MSGLGILPTGWSQQKLPPRMDGSEEEHGVYQGPKESMFIGSTPPIIPSVTKAAVVIPQKTVVTPTDLLGSLNGLSIAQVEETVALMKKKLAYMKVQPILIDKLEKSNYISNPVENWVLVYLSSTERSVTFACIPFEQIGVVIKDKSQTVEIHTSSKEEFEMLLTSIAIGIQERLLQPIEVLAEELGFTVAEDIAEEEVFDDVGE